MTEAGTGKTSQKGILAAAVICIITGIIVVPLLVTGSVKCMIREERLDIQISAWPDTFVSYDAIETVEYIDDLSVGSRTYGLGTFKVRAGNFNNNEFGAYRLYSYVKAEEYVIIHTDKEIIAVGLETSGETKALYDGLLEKIG